MRTWCIGARALFGEDRGDAMHGFMVRLTGHRCPCTHEQPCPLLPRPAAVDAQRWDDAAAGLDSITPQALALRLLD